MHDKKSASAYAQAAITLQAANRIDDADYLLSQAPIAMLADADFMWEWAWVAYRRKDYGTAVARWRIFRVMFPDNPLGYSGLAVSLREGKDFDGAEQVLQAAMHRYPDEFSPAYEHATLATIREDWAEAARRWETLRTRFPHDVRCYVGAIRALIGAGQRAAAEAALRDALARFDNEPDLLIPGAELAEAQHDWHTAAARWEAAAARDRGNVVIGHRLAVARMRAAETPDAPPPPAQPMRFADADETIPESERSAMFALTMGFESLGGARVGCEFGGVQRRFGAEPLGLLRWSEVRPDQLIQALDTGFDGVGLPENTTMYPWDDKPDAEYITVDKRYGLLTHTFASAAENDAAVFYTGVCRRLQFLRRKFLEDLAEARKIFVYKIDGVDMPDADIMRLHAGLCRYGRNTLLCVRLADAAHPDGTVERIAPGVMVGYLWRFADGTNDPVSSWATICQTASAMRQADSA
jgi:tetratricopeptide (TPR) repeat protein